MKRFAILLVAILFMAATVSAQTGPQPNVDIKIPQGWYGAVQPDGSVVVSNDEDYLGSQDIPPEGVTIINFNTSFDSTLNFEDGGDYLLGQMAAVALFVGGVEETPRLEPIPELDTNGFRVAIDGVDFWFMTIPTQIEGYVMMAVVRGDTDDDNILSIIGSAKMSREIPA